MDKNNKVVKRIIMLFVVLGLIGYLASVIVDKGGKPQTIDNGMSTFQIPGTWEKNSVDSYDGYEVYKPSDINNSGVSTSVIVQMTATGQPQPEYEVAKESFYSNIEEVIKAAIPDVEITNLVDYKAPFGYIFEITSNFQINGSSVNQVESYYITDNYLCTITASDFGHDISPTVFEVSDQVIETMVFKDYSAETENEKDNTETKEEATSDDSTAEETDTATSTEPTVDAQESTETEVSPETIPTELLETKGIWEGNIYTNELIDFSFTLPNDWVHLSWGEIDESMGQSALDAYEIFAYSPDENEIIQVYREKYIGDTTVAEYVEIAKKQMLESSSKKYTINDTYNKTIDGKEYTVIDSTSVDAVGVTLQEYNFVTQTGESFLCITATCPVENSADFLIMVEQSIS